MKTARHPLILLLLSVAWALDWWLHIEGDLDRQRRAAFLSHQALHLLSVAGFLSALLFRTDLFNRWIHYRGCFCRRRWFFASDGNWHSSSQKRFLEKKKKKKKKKPLGCVPVFSFFFQDLCYDFYFTKSSPGVSLCGPIERTLQTYLLQLQACGHVFFNVMTLCSVFLSTLCFNGEGMCFFSFFWHTMSFFQSNKAGLYIYIYIYTIIWC